MPTARQLANLRPPVPLREGELPCDLLARLCDDLPQSVTQSVTQADFASNPRSGKPPIP